jgi:hypothetical protein
MAHLRWAIRIQPELKTRASALVFFFALLHGAIRIDTTPVDQDRYLFLNPSAPSLGLEDWRVGCSINSRLKLTELLYQWSR